MLKSYRFFQPVCDTVCCVIIAPNLTVLGHMAQTLLSNCPEVAQLTDVAWNTNTLPLSLTHAQMARHRETPLVPKPAGATLLPVPAPCNRPRPRNNVGGVRQAEVLGAHSVGFQPESQDCDGVWCLYLNIVACGSERGGGCDL